MNVEILADRLRQQLDQIADAYGRPMTRDEVKVELGILFAQAIPPPEVVVESGTVDPATGMLTSLSFRVKRGDGPD